MPQTPHDSSGPEPCNMCGFPHVEIVGCISALETIAEGKTLCSCGGLHQVGTCLGPLTGEEYKSMTGKEWVRPERFVPTQEQIHRAARMMEQVKAYSASSNAELRRQLELAYTALREIGEHAVVDWQDKLVGLTSAALKNDAGQVEYWSTAKKFKQRAESAESALERVRDALRYVIDVRKIKCEHKHPAPDDCCAKCIAESALSPASQTAPVNYVSEIRPCEHPSCHVYGAEMVAAVWKCLSCGTRTDPSAASQSAPPDSQK